VDDLRSGQACEQQSDARHLLTSGEAAGDTINGPAHPLTMKGTRQQLRTDTPPRTWVNTTASGDTRHQPRAARGRGVPVQRPIVALTRCLSLS
jgi:hypothetical protein